MSQPLSLLLVGIGGYGNEYVEALLDNPDSAKFTIAGVVDPYPNGCKRLAELKALGVPIFSSMEDFYSNSQADLAIISSPIQYHRQQTEIALANHSHVLCEKPISSTIQDGLAMIDARNQAQKLLAIGYQWNYSPAVLGLKADIHSGVLGKPRRLKTIILWPRDDTYYSRSWAGKQKDAQGNLILDSVASNATAHFLQNMLFVLGDKMDTSAMPQTIQAELYRANDIENFDTSALRVMTNSQVELLFFATHATKERLEPSFVYQFDNALVEYCAHADRFGTIIAHFNDGSTKDYGNPYADSMRKLWVTMDAVSGQGQVPCSAEAALSHTYCINGIHLSSPQIPNFPAELVSYDDAQKITWVDGLSETFKSCYENWQLPNEAKVPWARVGKTVDVSNLERFEGEGL